MRNSGLFNRDTPHTVTADNIEDLKPLARLRLVTLGDLAETLDDKAALPDLDPDLEADLQEAQHCLRQLTRATKGKVPPEVQWAICLGILLQKVDVQPFEHLAKRSRDNETARLKGIERRYGSKDRKKATALQAYDDLISKSPKKEAAEKRAATVAGCDPRTVRRYLKERNAALSRNGK